MAIARLADLTKGFLNMNNLVLVVILGLAIVWSISSISALNRNYALQQQVDQAKLDNQIIQLQNQNLKLQQSYYKTDEFLGLEARALLGKANAGENLVLLPQSSSIATTSSSSLGQSSSSDNSANKSNFDQWMEFLFGSK